MVVSKEGTEVFPHSNLTKTSQIAKCASLTTIELSLSSAMSFSGRSGDLGLLTCALDRFEHHPTLIVSQNKSINCTLIFFFNGYLLGSSHPRVDNGVLNNIPMIPFLVQVIQESTAVDSIATN